MIEELILTVEALKAPDAMAMQMRPALSVSFIVKLYQRNQDLLALALLALGAGFVNLTQRVRRVALPQRLDLAWA